MNLTTKTHVTELCTFIFYFFKNKEILSKNKEILSNIWLYIYYSKASGRLLHKNVNPYTFFNPYIYIIVLNGTEVAGAKQTPMDYDSEASNATDNEARKMRASLKEQKRLQKKEKEDSEDRTETLEGLEKCYSKCTS